MVCYSLADLDLTFFIAYAIITSSHHLNKSKPMTTYGSLVSARNRFGYVMV